VLEINEQFARDYFKDSRLAPQFDPASAAEPKDNGDIGLDAEIDVDSWLLAVDGAREGVIPESGLDIAAIKALPHVEMVTELKCIEGWSQVVHWEVHALRILLNITVRMK